MLHRCDSEDPSLFLTCSTNPPAISPEAMHTPSGGDLNGLPKRPSIAHSATAMEPNRAPSCGDESNQTHDELIEARNIIADIQKTCNELQHKVRSLEAAKLLWEITRMSMEFQSIKDRDETHRQRNALEDELIVAKNRARHFEHEHTKLLRDSKIKEKRLIELEEKVKLLKDKNLMDERLEALENQVKQLEHANKEAEARELELLEMLERQDDERMEMRKPMTRSAIIKEMRTELWNRVNPASWLRPRQTKARDVTSTYPDLELLDLLKREVPKLALRPQFNRHSIT
ncbi:hypothetical protein Ae201684P_006573 [Aphanomyces euteiches]|uniref:Uncharacterized protein n=1 Tax=Aphanomyces euteiches TaxID=100861 RepID=A0A6G0XB84_9STRA|nr:hypothetical protein Ae201684_006519 [Aphanomyces euteiches]KAH9091173.1 hypothetical protein Ae201684P_006573 [Aphanomyces euteiches]KAH9156174.1 hypothetical protein AeRB84_001894 [Aphanomyces euteiches]